MIGTKAASVTIVLGIASLSSLFLIIKPLPLSLSLDAFVKIYQTFGR
jgi:hypothetical protein